MIGFFWAAVYLGRCVQYRMDNSMSRFKHKSELFKDVKIPDGEDFWRR